MLPPSSVGAALNPSKVKALVVGIAERAEVKVGGAAMTTPKSAPQEPTERGELVHGWMATAGLGPTATKQAAVDYLLEQWQSTDEPLADWLVHLSEELPRRQPDVYAVLTEPGARRYHEVPLVGVDADGDEQRMYAGRIDLVVERADGGCWIIDWKGENFVNRTDLAKSANLEQYAPQVEAYRRSLERMGKRVEKVGLLFAGGWHWVGW